MPLRYRWPSCRTLLSTSSDRPGSIITYPRCRKPMQAPHISLAIPLPVADPQLETSAASLQPTANTSGSWKFQLEFALFLSA